MYLELTDDQLLAAYQRALELNIEEDFIKLLVTAILARGLTI